jgi:hypothetical protein
MLRAVAAGASGRVGVVGLLLASLLLARVLSAGPPLARLLRPAHSGPLTPGCSLRPGRASSLVPCLVSVPFVPILIIPLDLDGALGDHGGHRADRGPHGK